jgi:hypothetical protein
MGTYAEEDLAQKLEALLELPVDVWRMRTALVAFGGNRASVDAESFFRTGLAHFVTGSPRPELHFTEGQAVRVHAGWLELHGVRSEAWVQELASKVSAFDGDGDGALNTAELLAFIVRGLQEPEEDAEGTAHFFMFGGTEADLSFLAADGDGMTLAGVVDFYKRASVRRAADVRDDLQALGLVCTVPERLYEKENALLGKAQCTLAVDVQCLHSPFVNRIRNHAVLAPQFTPCPPVADKR